jgi:hypothetical protein
MNEIRQAGERRYGGIPWGPEIKHAIERVVTHDIVSHRRDLTDGNGRRRLIPVKGGGDVLGREPGHLEPEQEITRADLGDGIVLHTKSPIPGENGSFHMPRKGDELTHGAVRLLL